VDKWLKQYASEFKILRRRRLAAEKARDEVIVQHARAGQFAGSSPTYYL
jgi:hypothetical protein